MPLCCPSRLRAGLVNQRLCGNDQSLVGNHDEFAGGDRDELVQAGNEHIGNRDAMNYATRKHHDELGMKVLYFTYISIDRIVKFGHA
ncbi:MAG: hypothetical protein WD469_01845 [Paenibacillaceae bacterium]